ncbi:MAG: DUF1272 domain-containing protein [Alphaproteobacteria bacterium]|nr:DUF1272 domain-containing protein [Alphaproteobacteria bacterium SS10]
MLVLRPNCRLCGCDLPPDSTKARICSYECTYCSDCVDGELQNVCPTCGGGFVPRPIRPRKSWRPERQVGLEHHPATTEREGLLFSKEDIAQFVARIKDIPPEER